MNTSESDSINKTFYPGWLMVSQLRCGQPVTDGEALLSPGLSMGDRGARGADGGGVERASAEQMLDADCALLR